MLLLKNIVLCLLIAVLLPGCATVFSPRAYNIKLNSVPRQAEVTVYNRKGIEVFSGTTPCSVKLKSSAGLFMRGIYTMEFSRNGYVTTTHVLRASLNEWYLGNILIGGWVGLLFVDPVTGAMYRLKRRDIYEILAPQ